jgi:hypothetical protein
MTAQMPRQVAENMPQCDSNPVDDHGWQIPPRAIQNHAWVHQGQLQPTHPPQPPVSTPSSTKLQKYGPKPSPPSTHSPPWRQNPPQSPPPPYTAERTVRTLFQGDDERRKKFGIASAGREGTWSISESSIEGGIRCLEACFEMVFYTAIGLMVLVALFVAR